jgi:Tol biopolymer transport system component
LSDRAGKENIYLMNIEPSAPKRVGPSIESDQPLDPAYSPDGRHIAYQLPGEISVFDIQAGTSRSVIKTSAGGDPTFLPDGQKILFQERIEENTEVCQVNVDGSGFVNLTTHRSGYVTYLLAGRRQDRICVQPRRGHEHV